MAKQTDMYELMYIVNPVLSDEQTKEIVNRVTKFIEDNGGEIVEVEERGSQRLSFPIQKKKNGYYVLTIFRSAGTIVAPLERALKINDDVLRHMVLRYDTKMQRHYEQQGVEKAQAAAEQPAEQPAESIEQPAEA
jgi:small subunit ribosomal protein S6